jgi:ribosomal protein L4
MLEAQDSALLVSSGPMDANLILSVRNLPGVSALPANEVTAFDVVSHDRLILLDGAFEALAERTARTGKGHGKPAGERRES